jgi:hypothetical protein
MVKNPFPLELPTLRPFPAVSASTGTSSKPANPQSGGPHRLNAGPGGQAYPPRAHRPVQQMNEKVSS